MNIGAVGYSTDFYRAGYRKNSSNDSASKFTTMGSATQVLSFKLDAPSPCRLDAPDLDLICYASADCLHQHLQVI